jgi:hypothetical protein
MTAQSPRTTAKRQQTRVDGMLKNARMGKRESAKGLETANVIELIKRTSGARRALQ